MVQHKSANSRAHQEKRRNFHVMIDWCFLPRKENAGIQSDLSGNQNLLNNDNNKKATKPPNK